MLPKLVTLKRERALHEQQFARDVNVIPGRIAIVGGSVHPNGRKDMVWVSELGLDGSRVAVYNETAITAAGTPVLIGTSPKPPFRRRVIGLYNGDADPTQIEVTTIYMQGNHAKNHQYPSELSPGEDPVLVFQPAIQMFKGSANDTNLVISVRGGNYIQAGVNYTFPGDTIDLTDSLPAASMQNKTMVYFDTITGALKTVSGAAVPDIEGTLAPLPEIPAGAIPVCYVNLFDYTTVIETFDVTDARTFFSPVEEAEPVYNSLTINNPTGQALSRTYVYTLTATTTDSAPTELYVDVDNSTQLVIDDDTTWVFSIQVAARRADANGESAGYWIRGVIDNNNDAVALVGSVDNSLTIEDTTAWDVSVSADNTNKALRIVATGESGKTIAWVATVTITEASG